VRLDTSARSAARTTRVSQTSFWAWCVGLIEAPTAEEFPYTERMLPSVGEVPLRAILRRARSLLSPDPPPYLLSPPPESDGKPVLHSIDVDLFEALLQATTSAEWYQHVLFRARRLYVVLDAKQAGRVTPGEETRFTDASFLEAWATVGCVCVCGGAGALAGPHCVPCCAGAPWQTTTRPPSRRPA